LSKSDNSTTEKIRRGILSRYPLIYIRGREEGRMESLLSQICAEHYPEERPLITWTAGHGFSDSNDCRDPMEALVRIRESQQPGIYLLKDLPDFFPNNPTLVRMVRDLYYDLRGRDSFLFFSYPDLLVPETLRQELYLVEMVLPKEKDIRSHLAAILEDKGLAEKFTSASLQRLAVAMVGLSLDEVEHLFSRLLDVDSVDMESTLHEVHEEKSQVLEKEGCLRYIQPDFSLDRIGGLENLKEWVLTRKNLFTEEAFEAGIPFPSGIILMGVSGCGKTMAAKTIAAAWNVPLVRLDMSLVLSGQYGSPEYAFERAIRTAEEVAPIVLWIDELENSFGYDEQSPGRGNINIFSSFLTWMQEKPSNVFVAATANRIQLLPAELMRKGRFDQLFFLDLPSKEERMEIFRIHIGLQGGDPQGFDLGYLAAATKDWTGAEIEQAVIAARVDAFQEKRTFEGADISHNVGQMVPLSHTMREQIKAIKDWSFGRAVPASAEKQ
jgi:ATP-dependent 26S proteasome regulatory subunit